MKKDSNNLAFIDGQNLHLGTQSNNWKIDHERFYTYLREKYGVTKAYYYFGYLDEELNPLYTRLQEAGFVIMFREHSSHMIGKKKGNVDTDIVFDIMKRYSEDEIPGKIILVSGDGDYKKLVNYLIEKNVFLKILFPCQKFASSLYKKLGNQFTIPLDRADIRKNIEYKK